MIDHLIFLTVLTTSPLPARVRRAGSCSCEGGKLLVRLRRLGLDLRDVAAADRDAPRLHGLRHCPPVQPCADYVQVKSATRQRSVEDRAGQASVQASRSSRDATKAGIWSLTLSRTESPGSLRPCNKRLCCGSAERYGRLMRCLRFRTEPPK